MTSSSEPPETSPSSAAAPPSEPALQPARTRARAAIAPGTRVILFIFQLFRVEVPQGPDGKLAVVSQLMTAQYGAVPADVNHGEAPRRDRPANRPRPRSSGTTVFQRTIPSGWSHGRHISITHLRRAPPRAHDAQSEGASGERGVDDV